MSTNSSIDSDSFQKFLANSFAVQESGLDSKSLSALIEIQHFVGNEEVDLDGAIRMIAEEALKVSSASGVAIALLENGELVYRAGSGRATEDIGRRVPAVLGVTSVHHAHREILRVENAGSDTRIEAEICRQFGAMSLLMLPIYRDQTVAGVLQVVSEKAHRFDDREVRTYRLMIAALESGMLRPAGARANEAAIAAEPVSDAWIAVPGNLESAKNTAVAIAAVAETRVKETREDCSKPFNVDRFEQPGTRAWLTYRSMQAPHRSPLWVAIVDALKATTGSWSADLRRSGAVIGIAVALSVAVWISHHHSSSPDMSTPSARIANSEGTTFTSPERHDLAKLGDQMIEPTVPTGFRRVRVGPNEVDDIAEDVTIRYFEAPANLKMRRNMKEVNFGEDVTVRYFPDSPVTVSQPAAVFESGSPQQTSIRAR